MNYFWRTWYKIVSKHGPNSNYFNPLSASFTKWSNTLEQFVDKLPTNCLSVFDHFVGLGRKGLTLFYAKIKTSNSPKLLLVFKTFSILLKKKKNYGKSKFVIAIKSVDVCVKFVSNLTFTKRAPSIVPVDPKLQQEPQTAWSFTGVTAPITMKSKIVLICLVFYFLLNTSNYS